MYSAESKTLINLLVTPEILPISSPYDWVQIILHCDDIKSIRWVYVVFAEITLYNLHRIILYTSTYADNLGLEHYFFINNQKYGSGIGDNSKRLSDRKARLMQVLPNIGENFQYVYGKLSCSLVVMATKNGTKEKISWLPRICSGSIGTFPPESECADLEQIRQYNPTRFLNIDAINKLFMHERFGANQQTNKREKRLGPSILCQSAQPHSTISLIYKRPIIDLYESSDDSDEDEENSTWEKGNRIKKMNLNKRKVQSPEKLPFPKSSFIVSIFKTLYQDNSLSG